MLCRMNAATEASTPMVNDRIRVIWRVETWAARQLCNRSNMVLVSILYFLIMVTSPFRPNLMMLLGV